MALFPPPSRRTLRSNQETGILLAQYSSIHFDIIMDSPLVIRQGLSGFGPRNAQYVVHLALLLLSLQDRLADARKKGIDFKFHLTIFEKQPKGAGIGPGFETDCDAAMNTGVRGLPDIKNLDKVDPAFVALADHAGSIATWLEGNRDGILSQLRVRNPVAAVLFEKAFRLGGKVNTSIACTTRGELGRLLDKNISSALDYIRNNMQKLLVVDIHYGHEVTGVDFTNPQKPFFIVSQRSEAPTYYEFDFVTLAHGSPLVSSVSAEVSAKAYSLTPNHDTLKAYLNAQGVLDTQGFILPGKSIAVTGVSLSAYDYATLLLPFLRGFELSPDDPAGFKFDPDVAKQYKGLITFISESEYGPAPPHLTIDHTWRGKTSLLSTEEMHALRLHRQSDWLSPSYKLLRASVAYSTGKLPSNVAPERTVQDYMQFYSEENDQYLKDGDSPLGRSETALLHAGFVAFSKGSGLEKEPNLAEESLTKKAPLTREGRFGWSMFYAAELEMSSCAKDIPDNATFLRLWDQLHHFMSTSPVTLQHPIALLFHHDIATHQSAAFDQLGITVTTDKVALDELKFDALLAPRKILCEVDRVLAPLEGRVKEHYPGMPEYVKGMHLQTVDNEPVSIFGAGNWGVRFHDEDGQMHVLGEQWNKTNSYDAAGTFATHHAFVSIMIAFALVITPGESPLNMISALHRDMNPSLDKFQREVRNFEGVWKGIQEKLVFVQLCEELAKCDPEYFASAIDHASTADDRNRFIKKQAPELQRAYADRVAETPRFNAPKFPAKFEKQFVSYTIPQLETMLDHMFRMMDNF